MMHIISDFDGTITNACLVDCIISDVFSSETLHKMNVLIDNGGITVTDYMKIVCDKINMTPLSIPIIAPKYNVIVDVTFKKFYYWCLDKKYNFHILSSGTFPVVNYFVPYVERNNIITNDISHDNKFIFNELVNPKRNYITSIKKQSAEKIVYIGDGSSDFNVIGTVDILFAKRKSALETKCIKENIPHVGFDNFLEIMEYLQNNAIE